MATPIQMPKVGISVESCILTKWHAKVGDSVKKGDILFTYETDKTTVDEEAQESGVLLAIFNGEGDEVPVMEYVGVIGAAGEDYSQFMKKQGAADPAPAETPATAAAAAETPAKSQSAPAAEVKPAAAADNGRLKISPRAKVLADKSGVDASKATPSGAEGRIVESDIKALLSSATGVMSYAATGAGGSGIGGRLSSTDGAAAVSAGGAKADAGEAYYDEKISNTRKTIAKAMMNSLSTMAQLTNISSFDAGGILEYRSKLKENAEKLSLPNITINDIVLYAVSRVLVKHKDINANFTDDTLRHFYDANLGIAVDTPKGLLVPTLFSANKLSLAELSASAKELVKKAQDGTIAPDMLRGGSFTVTNLGSLGVESFTPIINPPQTAILGVGCITDAVKSVGGEIKLYKKMTLSLTYDHRVVDGAPAAKFLKEVCDYLENFSLVLAL